MFSVWSFTESYDYQVPTGPLEYSWQVYITSFLIDFYYLFLISFAVVSTLLNFTKMFGRAHGDNCKQLELEKKKAQKEADHEKLKLASQKREAENALRPPIRSGETQ